MSATYDRARWGTGGVKGVECFKKVNPKVRNHGEGPSWLKAATTAFTFNSLLPRIDFSYLGRHKTYFWVGRG